MSRTRTVKGWFKELKLKSTYENWCMGYHLMQGKNLGSFDLGNFYVDIDDGFFVHGKKVYEIRFEELGEDIEQFNKREDGKTDFLLRYYDGGTGIEELITDYIGGKNKWGA